MAQLRRDVLAGIIVGIVALPLAIAFAIASGVSPDKGLITAIVGGLIISGLGGSRVQIGGPTGAFIVIVYGIVQEYGLEGLVLSTFMAGLLLIGMGIARLGNLLKFIPYPLIVGFTSGIAVIIFSSQIKDFFGLPIEQVPADFIEKWRLYMHYTHDVNWMAALIAIGTMLIALQFHRVSTKIPGSIVAILLSTLIVYTFDLPVRTIATAYGEIPNHISFQGLPSVDFEIIKSLVQPAFAIALLGGIESLLSAVVADGMIGGRHRSNMELVAQGMANCTSSLFGGIPATGAIARTATNVKNGGRTPISGIVHALVLVLIMLLLAPWAKLIPMSCLAGILMVVAYHMSEWRQFKSLLKGHRDDVMILLVTFILTILFDLIVAIEIGVVLSSFVFMKRMSNLTTIQSADDVMSNRQGSVETLFEEELPKLPKGVTLYEINGALFFGAAQSFQDAMYQLSDKPKVIILRMRHVPFIDATGSNRLKDVILKFSEQKISVLLSGVNEHVRSGLASANLYDVLDKDHILDNVDEALIKAQSLLQSEEFKTDHSKEK